MVDKGIRWVRIMTPTILIAALIALCGCDKKFPSPTPDTSVNDYLCSLPSWESFSPMMSDADEQGIARQERDWENKVVRLITPCSITRTPEEIVTYNPGSEILYIGSLIQGKGYLGGVGSMSELPIRQRAPLTISIDLQYPDNTRVVQNPDLASVSQAIGELVAGADAAGHKAGSSIYFDQKINHSVEQSALALGLSAKFMGATVKSSLEAERTQGKNSLAAYFIQKMFTTSMVLPQRPGDIFNADFTWELLEEQVQLGRIEPDNLPVFVSNIVWGRMLVLTMTSSLEEEKMRAALSATYYNINGTVSTEHLETLTQSEISLVTVGGDAQAALDLIRSGLLGEYFKDDAPLTTAVPISYTLRNLGDNTIARISETTEYDLIEYSPFMVKYIGNEAEWRNAVLNSGLTIFELKTNATNVSKATEVNQIPGGNQALGMQLTFEGANTTFPFDFYLRNTAVDSSHSKANLALVYADQEGGDYKDGWISIGDAGDFEDDDFEVGVTDTLVYAIAVEFGGNEFSTDEWMEVYGAKNQDEKFLRQFNSDSLQSFLGVVSSVPLRRILFNESADGDDAFLRDFRFGVRLP